MSVTLKAFKPLDPTLVDALWKNGLRTIDDLLDRSATDADREQLATELGVESDHILSLACRADLARIKGIGNLYAELLKHAEVHRIQDLATQNIENLYTNIVELNQQHRIARRVPKMKDVGEWINGAKGLPPVVRF